MNWIKKHSIEFQKDKLRILISKVNWDYNKNYIKGILEDISKEANANGIEVAVYDYDDNPRGFGFDGLNLQIHNKLTDNMIQKKEKDGAIIFNHHLQRGAALMMTYNAIGQINVMVSPVECEDSLAEYRNIILYHSYDEQLLQESRLKSGLATCFIITVILVYYIAKRGKAA
ncbi:hypothetical protein [Yersinia intermedia]|uniref:hypothetical protein n=1 Tax=Yersinia intermedia TaxID=631 RepID=UPI0030CAC293